MTESKKDLMERVETEGPKSLGDVIDYGIGLGESCVEGFRRGIYLAMRNYERFLKRAEDYLLGK